MYKIRIKIMMAALLFCGLSGCGEKDYNSALNVGNDTPHYVYTSTATETNISATDMIDMGTKEASYEFKVNYGVTDAKTATVEATIGPDFTLVETYNKNKSKNLKPFPEAHLSFPTTSANIASGSTETTVSFKIVDLDLLPNGEYLLPVTIKSANASNGFKVHESKKTSYFLISNRGAVLKGRWTFDDASNLVKATVGRDLQIGAVTNSANLSPNDFSQVAGPKDGQKAVRVPKGRYFKMPHDIAPGSSGKVEEYTLVVDVKLPKIGEYFTIFQTDMNNKDDADIFINGSGKVGIGSLPYSKNSLTAGVWYRLIFSAKMGSWFRIYLNGDFFPANNEKGEYNDISNHRFYFDPAGVILFGDEDGEDEEFDIAEVAIYEGAMGEVRIKSLGGAGN